MQIIFLVMMFLLGAGLGSFLCCQARRLRERELCGRKKQNFTKSTKPAKPAKFTKVHSRHQSLGPRSVCLHCHKQLNWYDNIPIASWLILRGKCRFCHHKIGALEILSELGLAIAVTAISAHFLYTAHAFTPVNFVTFPTIQPLNWLEFITILALTLSLGFLAIYDGAYGELPVVALTISLICAIITVILQSQASLSFVTSATTTTSLFSGSPWSPALSALISAVIFGGIYLALYLVSHGKWVGDGDWLLATTIGLVLGHPWLVLIALLIANLTATIIAAPAAIKHKNHQIYFGPYLVFAFIVTYTFSDFFISMI